MSSNLQRFVRTGTLSNLRHGKTTAGDSWLSANLTTQQGVSIRIAAFGKAADQLLPLADGCVHLLGYFRVKRFHSSATAEPTSFSHFSVLYAEAGHSWANLPDAVLARMVWSYPVRVLADFYGVSDVAIGKRCKRLGIAKPGRGFWAKVHSGERAHPRGVPQAA